MTPEQKRRANDRQKRYWARNRERLAEKKSRHYHLYRDKYLTLERERNYQKLYGMTIADYDAMLLAQGGSCAICKSKSAGNKGQYFAIDHCHKTGKIRGLLCITCNSRLGWIEWFETFRKVIEGYLNAPKN